MASRYQIVCMVVDCGSLKGAADELGYTQSAVSRPSRHSSASWVPRLSSAVSRAFRLRATVNNICRICARL